MPCQSELRSEKLLKTLVDRDVLQDLSTGFPRDELKRFRYATSKLSSLFDASKRSGKELAISAPFEFHGVDVHLHEVDWEWQGSLDDLDLFWEHVHSGKQALTHLWNSSRLERGLQQTEIRVVIQRQSLLPVDQHSDSDEGFSFQAESIAQLGSRLKKCALQSSSSDGLTMYDDGVWADPDIFSLVDTMPWLSYRQYDRYGCYCWTGELPRDNNPTSSSGGIAPRVVLPALIKMDENQLDELGRLRLKSSRRARKSIQEQGTESKRQRSGAATGS